MPNILYCNLYKSGCMFEFCSADNQDDKIDCRHSRLRDLDEIKCGTCESLGHSGGRPACGLWLGAGETEFVKDTNKRLECCPIETKEYPHKKHEELL